MLPEWVERECNWMGRGSSAREEEELPGESALFGGTSLPVPVAPSHPVSLGVFVYVCVFGGAVGTPRTVWDRAYFLDLCQCHLEPGFSLRVSGVSGLWGTKRVLK